MEKKRTTCTCGREAIVKKIDDKTAIAWCPNCNIAWFVGIALTALG